MAVIIRGIDVPLSCFSCNFRYKVDLGNKYHPNVVMYCPAVNHILEYTDEFYKSRPENCKKLMTQVGVNNNAKTE